MATSLEMIQQATEKLKIVLTPAIKRDYPDFSDDLIDYGFRNFSSSVEKWYTLMEKHVIPMRGLQLDKLKDGEMVRLPVIIPWLALKPVDLETANKVFQILDFFLNMYDWLNKNGTN